MQVTAPPLYSVTVNVGPLLFDMQNEPQLEAGVGHRRVDAALAGFMDGLVYFGMFVAIENTPDLVEVVCATIGLCLKSSSPDQSHRGEAVGIPKLKLHLMPLDGMEVFPLRDFALGEHADDRSLFPKAGSCSPVFLRTQRHLKYVRSSGTCCLSRLRSCLSDGMLELRWIQRRDAAVAAVKVPPANGLVAPRLEIG